MTRSWTFDEIVAPVKAEDFLSKILGNSCLHLSGHSEKFSSLVSWPDINRILCRSGMDLTRVRLSSQTGDVPAEHFTMSALSGFHRIRVSALNQYLADGAVLMIDAAEDTHGPILEFCRAIERSLGVPVQAQIRCSFRALNSDAQTLGWRSYDHDVMVFGILGTCVWHLESKDEPGTLSGTTKSSIAVLDLELKPGDFLYIPRGRSYSDQFIGEPSMSIAVIFKNPTGVEITARLFERLREADLLKHDVPRFAGDDVRAAYLTALQGEIVRVCTEPGLLLGFMKDLWSISEPLLLTSLPWGAVEDTVPEDLEVAAAVRFPHNDTLTYSVWENTFEIVHEGQRIRLDSNAAKIMDCILTSGVLSVEKLAKSCDMPKGELLKYLSGMIKQGILIGRDPIAARTQVASRSFFARTDAPCL